MELGREKDGSSLLESITNRVEAVAAAGEAALAAKPLGELESFRLAHELLREQGLLGFAVPAAVGGVPVAPLAASNTVSVRALVVLRRALAFRHGMLDLALVEQGLGSFPLAIGSEEPEVLDVVGGIAEGRRIPALCLTEPGAGSDLAGVALNAREDGEDFVLRGVKTFITNVGVATDYAVLARTGGRPGERGGLTMFYVPHGLKGLESRPFQVMAPHPIGEVHFDGVRVPRRFLLGSPGEGIDLALGVLGRFRVTVAAAACGFGRRALAESVTHLKSREQFGRPLSSFQGLRFDLAEMDVRLRAAELLTDEAAGLVDHGEDAAMEVARAKLFATEVASYVADRAVQHHGGSGVRVGTVVERIFRDTRALRIYEGTSEIQKLVLSKGVLNSTADPSPSS